MVAIPAVFVEHRIYVRPVTAGGDTLIFYTDTGGGTDRIFAPIAERLELPQSRAVFGDDSVALAAWPDWREGHAIPRTADARGAAGGKFLVAELEGEATLLHDSGDAGFLGARWFADRSWTFDYPAGRLYLRSAGSVPPHDARQRVPLGFQVDAGGARTTHFPRIRVAIAGDSCSS